MSDRKLNQTGIGQEKPPLLKLKESSPDQRARVMEILRGHTYRDAERLVEEMVGFACSTAALFQFFHWQAVQEAKTATRDKLQEVATFLDQHKEWPEEKIMATAVVYFVMEAVKSADVKGFGLAARLAAQERCRRMRQEKMEFEKLKYEQVTRKRLEVHGQRFELDKLKFNESLRRKLDLGLDVMGKQFDKNPEALRLYQDAKKMIEG
jgi:hypothetical protein